MFGRGKSQQATSTAPAVASPVKDGGKGRPTPSRRQAQLRNHHPIVAGKPLAANATKAERKAARTEQRQAASGQRSLQRQALLTGDETNFPAQDRGAARRWARDYVDARRSLAEFMLPAALVILLLTFVRTPIVQWVSLILLYGMAIVVGVECFTVRRRLARLLPAKFGATAAQGAPGYAMARMLRLRRTRLPRPQVARGQFPQ